MRNKPIALAALLIAVLVGLPWTSLADPPDQAEPAVPPVHMVLDPPASQTGPAPDSASALAAGWETVKTENFEGDFPNDWELHGDPTWGREWDSDPAYPELAGWTGWCAGGGSAARTPGPLPGGEYAPNMDSWMIYGPFSLKGCSAAFVSFRHWHDIQPVEDGLWWTASTNGALFYGDFDAASHQSWIAYTFWLTDVPTLGNLAGKRRVWISFAFVSDSSVEYKGTYLDDIQIMRYRAAPPVNVSVDPEYGLASAGVWYSFDTTWSDLGGWADLKQCYVHFGTSPTLANNVTLLYNAQSNKVWLRNDAGTAWLGGYTIGTPTAIENTQAKVHPGTMSTAASGDNLTVTWAIYFKSAFVGTKKVGMKALDRWGAKASAEWMGTWVILE